MLEVRARGAVAGIAASPGAAGDGGPASLATVFNPTGVAVDTSPNAGLFIAGQGSTHAIHAEAPLCTHWHLLCSSPDAGNNALRYLWPNGTITRLAGNGTAAFAGDGGSALVAAMNTPSHAAPTSDGGAYVVETGSHVLRRYWQNSTLSTLVGNGTAGWGCDGCPATSALLNGPVSVAMDGLGGFLISVRLAESIMQLLCVSSNSV